MAYLNIYIRIRVLYITTSIAYIEKYNLFTDCYITLNDFKLDCLYPVQHRTLAIYRVTNCKQESAKHAVDAADRLSN